MGLQGFSKCLLDFNTNNAMAYFHFVVWHASSSVPYFHPFFPPSFILPLELQPLHTRANTHVYTVCMHTDV